MKQVVQRNESGEWVPVDGNTQIWLSRWRVESVVGGTAYLVRLDDYDTMQFQASDEIKFSLSLYDILRMVERMDVRLEEVPEVTNDR